MGCSFYVEGVKPPSAVSDAEKKLHAMDINSDESQTYFETFLLIEQEWIDKVGHWDCSFSYSSWLQFCDFFCLGHTLEEDKDCVWVFPIKYVKERIYTKGYGEDIQGHPIWRAKRVMDIIKKGEALGKTECYVT